MQYVCKKKKGKKQLRVRVKRKDRGKKHVKNNVCDKQEGRADKEYIVASNETRRGLDNTVSVG